MDPVRPGVVRTSNFSTVDCGWRCRSASHSAAAAAAATCTAATRSTLLRTIAPILWAFFGEKHGGRKCDFSQGGAACIVFVKKGEE